MITPSERELVLQLLDATQARVLKLLNGLSAEQLLYRPQPGCWSVAENVEHLIVTERRVVGAVEKLLLGPADIQTRCSLTDDEVLRKVGAAVNKVQAPPYALPTLRWPAEALGREFATTRASTRDFASATTADLRRYFMRHFLFGDLDGYQWLLLIGAHSQRHSAQAEAVRDSPSFPNAVPA